MALTSGLSILVHDHALLSSQVEHVGRLLRAVLGRRFDVRVVESEVHRQFASLRSQIANHFELEERQAFVLLCRVRPAVESAVDHLVSDHRRIELILTEVTKLCSSTSWTTGAELSRLVEDYDKFEMAYFDHVAAENLLLQDVEDGLSDQERVLLEELSLAPK